MKFVIIYCVLWSCCNCQTAFQNLDEKFSWRTLDYEFETEEARNQSIKSQEFIPENNVPFGVEVWREKVFITVPRRSPGIPSTLNYVNLDSTTTSPSLIPYPDWNTNNVSSRFQISTYRVSADKCNRLWTIDTGSVVDFSGKGEHILSPRIRIFNLVDDSIQLEYVLKPEDSGCNSAYTSIVVDITDSCEDSFAYMIDPGSNSILVYSLSKNQSWRIIHPYFRPDPLQNEYQIGNLEFEWDDGLFGLALGERLNKGYRIVYLHPMSSLLEFSTTTDVLQNQTASLNQYKRGVFKILGSRAPTFQAASSAYDERNGILFYSLVNKNAIGCWNAKKFNKFNHDVTDIVAADDVSMIYLSDVKVDRDSNIWAISNRLPLILYTNFDPLDVNFRVFSAPVRQVIRNTICEPVRSRGFWYPRN